VRRIRTKDRRRDRMTCVSSRIALLDGEGNTKNRSRGPHHCGFPRRERDCEARPTIYVVPSGAALPAGDGAVGLFVPGTGGTVSRARAIAALRRGTVESDFGTPGGKILVDLSSVARVQPLRPAVYISLPPPGEHRTPSVTT